MDRVYSICSLGRESITLGRQLDHNARRIMFDVGAWLAEYPGAVVTGYAIPPEGEGYPIALEMDGEMAIWTQPEQAANRRRRCSPGWTTSTKLLPAAYALIRSRT